MAVSDALEIEGVGDSARTYAVVFEEDFDLQRVLVHQRAGIPQEERGRSGHKV